jgi:hypothetical protein
LQIQECSVGFLGWFLLIVVLLVGAGILNGLQIKEKREAMKSHLDNLKDFTATQQVMSENGNTGLAFDEERKKLCLIRQGSGGTTNKVIGYESVIASEIFEDGAAVTRTVRSSQVGGAVVGGLLLGGVGALVGGLSGKTQTTNKSKRVELRLTINDTVTPIHDVGFLSMEVMRGSFMHKQAMEQARHWHALIEVLIKRADMEDKATLATSQPKAFSSIADELKKLVELRETGVLNPDEFQREKTKLLA